MSKTVLFFPGQASQYVGMGRDFYDSSDAVKKLYALASDEMGADIAKISFEGPSEELKRTRFTQPAILLHSLAVLTVLFIGLLGTAIGPKGALSYALSFALAGGLLTTVQAAMVAEGYRHMREVHEGPDEHAVARVFE